MGTINIRNFAGMSNINPTIDFHYGLIIPELLIDAYPKLNGKLVRRKGSSIILNTSECSNLWKSEKTGRIYCINNSNLCSVDLSTSTLTVLKTISQPKAKVYYTNIGPIDYISNKYWSTAIENGVARTFGQSAEDLQSLNWQTTEHGRVLYLKNAAGEETCVPHPGEFVHAPEPMDHLFAAFGRLWGVINNILYYSYPLTVEWWENSVNYFEFLSDITVACSVTNGIYIGTENKLYFLAGQDPVKMTLITLKNEGVVLNSLVPIPYLAERGIDVPSWVMNSGEIIAGLPGGELLSLTREKCILGPSDDFTGGSILIDGLQTLIYKIKGTQSII